MSNENKWKLFNLRQEQNLPKSHISSDSAGTSTKELPDLEAFISNFERKENQLGLGEK